MRASDLIEQLRQLDPDTDVDAWIKAKGHIAVSTLSYDDGGKAVRAIIAAIGKPFSNSAWDMNGRRFGYRTVIWKCQETERGLKASQALEKAGITDFRITPNGWLTIHIPEDAFLSDFTTSDEPRVWRDRNAKMVERLRKAKETEERNQVEKDKKQTEEQKAWNEKWQKELDERKREQERQEEIKKQAWLNEQKEQQKKQLEELRKQGLTVKDDTIQRGIDHGD